MLQLGPLHPEIDGLGLGVLELGFGQGNIVPGGDPAGVTVLSAVENFLEGGRDVVQEALLLIQGAQLKITLGQGGLGA